MKNFVFREFKFTEGRLVVFSLVGMVLVLVTSLMLIGNGIVSQTCCNHIQGNN